MQCSGNKDVCKIQKSAMSKNTFCNASQSVLPKCHDMKKAVKEAKNSGIKAEYHEMEWMYPQYCVLGPVTFSFSLLAGLLAFPATILLCCVGQGRHHRAAKAAMVFCVATMLFVLGAIAVESVSAANASSDVFSNLPALPPGASITHMPGPSFIIFCALAFPLTLLSTIIAARASHKIETGTLMDRLL